MLRKADIALSVCFLKTSRTSDSRVNRLFDEYYWCSFVSGPWNAEATAGVCHEKGPDRRVPRSQSVTWLGRHQPCRPPPASRCVLRPDVVLA